MRISKAKERRLKAIKEFQIKGELLLTCLRFVAGAYNKSISYFVEEESDNETKKALISLHNRITNIIAEYERILDTMFDEYDVLDKCRVDTDVVRTTNKILRGLGK